MDILDVGFTYTTHEYIKLFPRVASHRYPSGTTKLFTAPITLAGISASSPIFAWYVFYVSTGRPCFSDGPCVWEPLPVALARPLVSVSKLPGMEAAAGGHHLHGMAKNWGLLGLRVVLHRSRFRWSLGYTWWSTLLVSAASSFLRFSHSLHIAARVLRVKLRVRVT